MTLIDWVIVVVFLGLTLSIGFWFARRAGKSVDEFFVAGRAMPWWLAGTSMLATSFASDTPLHTTRMIRENGLPGAWFYWGGAFSGILIAVFFSRLWQRTGVVTDNEFIELRYAGRPAAVLRGTFALFKSLALEIITLAWVTLGMTKVVKAIMALPDFVAVPGVGVVQSEILVVVVLLVLAVSFSAASGLWGVASTDVVEFFMAMLGAIVLAAVALDRVGGSAGLREGLKATPLGEGALDLTPHFSAEGLTFVAFGVYLGVQWWATPYVDGSGHRAQRFLACKDEGQAIAAGIWNVAVQWIIRSWPWYVAALASLILYPTLADHEMAYPTMVAELLPVGLKGLMVASFIAAFMSTMEAHYNLTASYVVNDLYRRFIARDRSKEHYVRASRLTTLGVAASAGVLALLLPSVLGAFRFKMELMAGLGLVYVLRWVWWRINARTEIVTLAISIAAALALNWLPLTSGGGASGSALRLLAVVAVSGIVAVATATFTNPEPMEKLVAFYTRVRPPGAWGPVAAAAGGAVSSGFGVATLVQALLALLFVLASMIGLGKLILGEPALGSTLICVGGASGWATIRWLFPKKPKS